MTESLYHGLAAQARSRPESPAILAPDRQTLTFDLLKNQIDEVVQVLRSLGLRRHDRVALVLPNGPDAVVALLAVASCASGAPLNPAYQTAEFDGYLRDLKVVLLIVQQGMGATAREAAESLHIPVVELVPELARQAGCFRLAGRSFAPPAVDGFAQSEDVAILFQTSGTTAKPKRVPLSHANLLVSANNNQATLCLTMGDRYLNFMPLFHLHSILLIDASLLAGGSVVAAPSYEPGRFFRWLDELEPTWYSAAPTLHQAILSEASANRAVIARRPLRLIRSSAAPLPATVMLELEQVFGAPVIEAYGMTETPFPVTSNPLPPGTRKPGSVGIPSGPEVVIADGEGNPLPPGVAGEVVIRGGNVMRGYSDDPVADQTAFRDGWFRSGDLGYFDAEGYLFINGRIKEIINRGGEKISVREVEDALLSHPHVGQAVAFGVPHVSLGEDLVAAVTLRNPAASPEIDLRRFLAGRLAAFKVPQRIVTLESIPKTAIGKPDRALLSKRFGSASKPDSREPPVQPGTAHQGGLEETVAAIWADVLQIERVDPHDNFFDLGGDSIKLTQVVARLRRKLKQEIPLGLLFEYPTLDAFARELLNFEKV